MADPELRKREVLYTFQCVHEIREKLNRNEYTTVKTARSVVCRGRRSRQVLASLGRRPGSAGMKSTGGRSRAALHRPSDP